jgi:glycosyltransferase 2 family protein
MTSKSRKALVAVVGVLLLGFLLYHARGMFNLNQFSGANLWDSVKGAKYFYLLLSVFVIYVCYAIRALRWQKFQAHLGSAHFWKIYPMTLAGFSAVFLLGRPGEPVRPLLISRKENVPIADTFGVYALERILDLASAGVLAAIGLLVFESAAHSTGEGASSAFEKAMRTAGTAFAIGSVVAIAGLVYLRFHGSAVLERRMESWIAAHGWRAKVARILLGFSRGVQTIRTAGDLAAAVGYSAAHWCLVVLIYYFVAHSFGGTLATLTYADAMLVLVFTLVGSAVQLPAVGGGAQALSMFAFTKLYGVEQEPAFAAAMILWLITFASCCLVGVPLLLKEGWSFGELKRMRAEEDAEIDAHIADPPHPSP